MSKISLSHPTGNANVRALLVGLLRKGSLHRFYTSIAIGEGGLLYQVVKNSPFKALLRRSYSAEVMRKTRTQPLKELGRHFSIRFKIAFLMAHEKGIFSVDKIYTHLDRKVSMNLGESEAIYAYEDGAFKTFQKAKEGNIICFYDLPIGYWRAMRELLNGEKENRPDWAVTLTGFKDSREKLYRKDMELALADHIFVASSFTKETLGWYPGKLAAVHVVPYGFPEPLPNRSYVPPTDRKLKLLFVGGLSQRKGLANIFEAMDLLGESIELTIIGRKVVEDCIPLNKGLKQHRWINSLPHEEILEQMRNHDILIFPSLFEGYGLVVTEAMSQGTPVITTRRTCGADFIEDGRNGWLVEPGNTKQLVSKLKEILNEPEKIEAIGREAMRTAAKYPISEYGDIMAGKIDEILNSR
ncbi:glycosyltransferase family 4 protein [Gramella sp. GC03-9]|uniref:Glycosyltransferase family 4 protein n=1 Tax=Christiangramia oceanisediminis TaxID=2920386 RepID=A0A9X2I6M3_9FLAO|nr:glycosyltransferase family 4 protein [Gramella oceanisediminis]MCP9198699.1 glycosyltransferase family 4 protein [Gramella oceanisediminis]